MRLVIQKVKKCTVFCNGAPVSSIEDGYTILVCFRRGEKDNIEGVAAKVLGLQLFDSWRKNIADQGMELMVLSQFTLHARVKGRKPSFHAAEERSVASDKFDALVRAFQNAYSKERVKCGLFGASLEISTVLAGPCTIILDSTG